MDQMDSQFYGIFNSTTAQVVKPAAFTVGVIWLIRAFIYIVYGVRLIVKLYVVPEFRPLNLKKIYGEYVVITNVVDPIGAAFATAFAKLGHSLILITVEDESFSELKAKLESIMTETGGDLKVILKDPKKSDVDLYADIEKQLEDESVKSKIGILLNNAGIVGQSPGNFLQYTNQFVMKMTHTHVIDFLMITKFVLKVMYNNEKGLVVNVTAPRKYRLFTNSGFPLSMRQFADEFTKIVNLEFSRYPEIKIEVLNPGCIAVSDDDQPSDWCPTPDDFVKSAMPKIGRVEQTTGYWAHSIYETFMNLLPNFIYRLLCYIYQSQTKNVLKDGYSPISDEIEGIENE